MHLLSLLIDVGIVVREGSLMRRVRCDSAHEVGEYERMVEKEISGWLSGRRCRGGQEESGQLHRVQQINGFGLKMGICETCLR